MQHPRTMLLCIFAIVGSLVTVSAQPADRTVRIHAWPLDAVSPKQLAEISYNPLSLTSSVIRFARPEGSHKPENLIRVGLYDAETSEWRGVVTSAASFDNQYQQKLLLHVDESGNVWHVGFSAQAKPTKQPAKNGKKIAAEPVEQVLVEVVKPSVGPTPVLNKPVVLNPEGKVPEKEQEKTFIQKYWWIIAAFVVMQVVSAGGGEEKK